MLLIHEEIDTISDEIIAKLGEKYIGKSIVYEEYGAMVDFKDLSDDETLVEFFERFEKFIPQIEEIVEKHEKEEQISVQELGEQTLEEQEDTISKRRMKSRLSEMIKAYIVERGGNQK